eukprot:TRINITY_DN9211_c0_g1_i2.p1 TRINITY_DN9211_c0_g1~~TRINITY_DN9211_c0_g1_i2.p1  ORF type:complete len:261 (-),score=63.08 TRINITY_DN9211_c0_g1_i2:651-1433(-)
MFSQVVGRSVEFYEFLESKRKFEELGRILEFPNILEPLREGQPPKFTLVKIDPSESESDFLPTIITDLFSQDERRLSIRGVTPIIFARYLEMARCWSILNETSLFDRLDLTKLEFRGPQPSDNRSAEAQFALYFHNLFVALTNLITFYIMTIEQHIEKVFEVYIMRLDPKDLMRDISLVDLLLYNGFDIVVDLFQEFNQMIQRGDSSYTLLNEEKFREVRAKVVTRVEDINTLCRTLVRLKEFDPQLNHFLLSPSPLLAD